MAEIADWLPRVDPVGTTLRTVTINVNERCPLRCRHCSVGFSHVYSGTDRKIRPDDMRRLVASIDGSVYDMLVLAGGEPSLERPLLRVAIDACRAARLLSAVVTAPVWVAKESSAQRFLAGVAGLDLLILSYDRFHLEFLDIAHYDLAMRAAARRGIWVDLHISHTSEGETEELLRLLGNAVSLASVSTMRTVRVGNAAHLADLRAAPVIVEEIADLARIPRGCVLGNALIDEGRAVHGCCWAATVPDSPFSVPTRRSDVRAALNDLEEV